MSYRGVAGQIEAAAPEVLSTCASFWPLEQRLAAGTISRRWHEAMAVPEAWEVVEVPPEMMEGLLCLLKRFGRFVRRLRLGIHLGPLWSEKLQLLPARLAEVSKCPRLERLTLHALKGFDGFAEAPWETCRSLRVLELQSVPYFSLSGYNHHTGIRVATAPASWISKAFPGLEELVCDYLELEDVKVRNVTFEQLKKLSLVAVVQSIERGGQWNSSGCSRNLARLAVAAPHLECLTLREPKVHIGRMSRRPGQTVSDLVQMCRRFCATQVEALHGAARHFPRLRVLEVDTLQEEGPDGEMHKAGVRDFLGIDASSGRRISLRLGEGSPGSSEWVEAASSSGGHVEVTVVKNSTSSSQLHRLHGEVLHSEASHQMMFKDLLAKVVAAGESPEAPSSSCDSEEAVASEENQIELERVNVAQIVQTPEPTATPEEEGTL
mmetsp:Transcript_59684/g.142017  ORF Transcript_59684/g.142017 Transcript_59684/m.142017 type:complete len:436 (+) Transcript_59684:160-1467(+)